MTSKAPTTLKILSQALLRRPLTLGQRRKPATPKRILIAQKLRLGDAILITPLLAKLRAQYPLAELVMTARPAFVPLYQKRPYGIDARAYDSRDSATVSALLRDGGYDLAIVPGDNGPSWLASALGARWIVAHAGDRPVYKNWPVDEALAYPHRPTAMGEIFAELIPGPAPGPYRMQDWPAPDHRPFALPTAAYAVLHVGASTVMKSWPPEQWRALAQWLSSKGLQVVWSGGSGEAALVEQIDPQHQYPSYAEKLDLPQLWRLISGAKLMVSPDTGVAHLARLTGTPSITLYGPGSRVLFGAGEFWRAAPCAEIMLPDVACRDQHEVFQRQIPWARRCGRSPVECPTPRCMSDIGVASVIEAASRFLSAKRPAVSAA